MRRSAHSKWAGFAACSLAFWGSLAAQTSVTCAGGRCVGVLEGSAPAAKRLRIEAHGPVVLEGGVSRKITYTLKITLIARNEQSARRMLESYRVNIQPKDHWMVLATPGGPVMSSLTVRAPSLLTVAITTSDGAVEVSGIQGAVEAKSGAGELTADRIGGNCTLITGGGDVNVGQVGGELHCSTGAGRITVRDVRGRAVLETQGGDILAREAGGDLHAETGGGGIHIGSAGGAVSAVSGGGQIVVEKAQGLVTLRNLAGPVRVESAAGLRCETASGGVRIAHVTGPIRVSTAMGSIFADLLGGKIMDSFLATANGDITVLIPSNLGVTIQAQNSMADTLRRIISDFPTIPVRRQGTRIVAEGSLNGGGPLLQIAGTGGTIFIKRQ
jgi:hypothetical protein